MSFTNELKFFKAHLHRLSEKFGKDEINSDEIIDELLVIKYDLEKMIKDSLSDYSMEAQMQRYHINDEIAVINSYIIRTKSGNKDWF
jgi:hypothetical protein